MTEGFTGISYTQEEKRRMKNAVLLAKQAMEARCRYVPYIPFEPADLNEDGERRYRVRYYSEL